MKIAFCTLIFIAGFLAGVNMEIRPDYVQDTWRIWASIFFAILFTSMIVEGNEDDREI